MCSAAAPLPLSSARSAGARVLRPVPFALAVWRRAQRAAGCQGRNEFVQATSRDHDIALSTFRGSLEPRCVSVCGNCLGGLFGRVQ